MSPLKWRKLQCEVSLAFNPGCDFALWNKMYVWNLFLSELRLSLAVELPKHTVGLFDRDQQHYLHSVFCGAAGPPLQDYFVIFLLLIDKNLNMKFLSF